MNQCELCERYKEDCTVNKVEFQCLNCGDIHEDTFTHCCDCYDEEDLDVFFNQQFCCGDCRKEYQY